MLKTLKGTKYTKYYVPQKQTSDIMQKQATVLLGVWLVIAMVVEIVN